jgi:hypothetical protein
MLGGFPLLDGFAALGRAHQVNHQYDRQQTV